MNSNNISQISKIYAKSLFEIAESDDDKDVIMQQFSQVIDTIKLSTDLQIVMANSSISNSKKIEIIEDIFGSKIDKHLLSFLKVLIEKGRYDEIYNIYDSYCNFLKSNLGQKNVEITSAIELDNDTKDKIIERLKAKLNTEIIPNWKIDSNIIAGLVFKFDDYVIDSSIETKIKSLSRIKGIL